MSTILLAFGLVLVIEGLAFALAPSRMEDLVARIAEMPRDTRRLLGVVALGIGVGMIWISHYLGS